MPPGRSARLGAVQVWRSCQAWLVRGGGGGDRDCHSFKLPQHSLRVSLVLGRAVHRSHSLNVLLMPLMPASVSAARPSTEVLRHGHGATVVATDSSRGLKSYRDTPAPAARGRKAVSMLVSSTAMIQTFSITVSRGAKWPNVSYRTNSQAPGSGSRRSSA